MKFETKYKIMLWKRYFDTGYSFTSYVKYIFYFLALFMGFTEQAYLKPLAYAGVIYMVGCLPFGWAMYKYGWIEAEAEVGNRFNLFQKQVRKFIKK